MAAAGRFGGRLFQQGEINGRRKRAPRGGLSEAKLLLRLAKPFLRDELAVDRRRDGPPGGCVDVPRHRGRLGKCQLEEPHALGIGKAQDVRDALHEGCREATPPVTGLE